MASQTAHKYDDLKCFVSECKKYVKEIQNYSGVDPLAPWYAYLLWMEENFIIDFTGKETIFDEVLASCLCQFEHDVRYKQDRRLIKLFIKFVSKKYAYFNDQLLLSAKNYKNFMKLSNKSCNCFSSFRSIAKRNRICTIK